MMPQDPSELVELASYRRRREAEERGLVLLAMGIEYWIFRKDGGNALCVEEGNRAAALRELETFEAERAAHEPRSEPAGYAGKTSSLSLFVFGWTMGMFFLAQELAPADRKSVV